MPRAWVQKAARWGTGCVPSRLCVRWVVHSTLLFKTWQLSIACNQRSFAVEPSNSLVKYQTVIRLVQTSLKLDGVSFRMWLDELESKDLTCFVVFNVAIGLDPPSFEVSENRIQPFCHVQGKQIWIKYEPQPQPMNQPWPESLEEKSESKIKKN